MFRTFSTRLEILPSPPIKIRPPSKFRSRRNSIIAMKSGLLSMNKFKGSKEPFSEEMETGTTIIAIAYKGGVVLGADSRATTGAYVANRITDKLEPITKNIYCCRSGSSADTQATADYVRLYLSIHQIQSGKMSNVKTAANLFKDHCYSNPQYIASIICAGWDPVDGGSVYQIPIGGSLIKSPYCVGGSGSTYIHGFLDNLYKKDMSEKDCIDFVTRGLAHAMYRDGSSGGLMRYAVIDRLGVRRTKVVPGKKFPKVRDEKKK